MIKTISKILFCFIALSLAYPCSAQGRAKNNRQKEREEMIENVNRYKRDFLIKRLELSREQQNKFFPLYEEMNDEIMKVNADTRDAEQRIASADESTLGDIDFEMATNAMIDKNLKICDIEKKYYTRFGEFLTKKQLYLLKSGEQEINRKFLEHMRKRHND